MKRLEVIRELRRRRKLAEKRAIDYERNKTAKYVLMFLGGFVIVYLIFFKSS